VETHTSELLRVAATFCEGKRFRIADLGLDFYARVRFLNLPCRIFAMAFVLVAYRPVGTLPDEHASP
jgi:hypothetical protein